MSSIKRWAAILFVNIALLAGSIFLANLYLDFDNFRRTQPEQERQRLEAEARDIDAAYFRQCLSQDHVQIFYPDLLRQERYRSISESTGFLPPGPIPHTATAYCNEGNGFVRYTSDRFGFRNDDANWDRPVDVLFVGDSFVQGACVDEPYVLSNRVAERTGKNVVNIGTGSNGPNHYRALLDTFVPIVEPAYVVLVFFPNDNVQIDADDAYSTRQHGTPAAHYSRSGIDQQGRDFYRAVRPLMEPTSGLTPKIDCDRVDLTFPDIQKQVKADFSAQASANFGNAFVQYLQQIDSREKVAGLVKLRALRGMLATIGQSETEDPLTTPDATRAAIDALFEQCDGTCVPVIALLPGSEYWRSDWRTDTYLDFVTAYAKERAGNRDYKLLDARPLIDRNGLADFPPVGAHYSEEPYGRVGDAIAETIGVE
ncbi:hypothetical protein VQ045_02450 [Aurantimonas sp. E1-2-R+4]|uniref:hypothetical protein n=1 Tax=Aurantimonas sp. E1-2-R+4 TaxID=3113714 RepID=UPI002F94A0AE